jgi:hypothetical protein
MRRNQINVYFTIFSSLLVFFTLCISGCNKGSSSSGVSINDNEFIFHINNWYKNSFFEGNMTYVRLENPQITILDKGSLTDKKELPIKVSIKGDFRQVLASNIEEAKKSLDSPDYRVGIDKKVYQEGVDNTYYDKVKVFYISKNDFGKTVIYTENHKSWTELP